MLIPGNLAKEIMASMGGLTDPSLALTKLWSTICGYITANAVVTYTWVAAQPAVPTPIPDPMLIWTGKILTGGTLVPSYLTDPVSAIANLALQMNTMAATWTIIPPAGFLLSPIMVIPSIILKPSQASTREEALTALATDIINGIKLATPVTTGSHGPFIGAGSFNGII